ncbi:hypothetical protein CONCODRAFT_68324 [Conidiobolus coronatus NRRL 28638]|uniref:Uncharacterized protein n=1 Tax=Conidiobolus coronatus (strain ATCC 28846 / CBS 209.66 / NRRL 28638) TaxID=796925 RepID=A0A137PEJ3_CONC2|nr:hypothetical protein CONCODRAFT_68324 [Conidiobolus coronatus NRRL 28638]|eukprot:KXN73419.1 hypothetical protein CONCODRAFT_68324 [Conidiobolus coronatus NRRL 28638]
MIWGIIGNGRNTHGSVRLSDVEEPSPSPPQSQPLNVITVVNSTSNQPSLAEPVIVTLQSPSNTPVVPNWRRLIYISNYQAHLKRIIESNSILNLTDFKQNLIYGFYFKILLVSFLAVILVLFFYFLEIFSKDLPTYFFTLKGIIIVLSLAVIMLLIIQLDTRLIKIKDAVREINRNRLDVHSQQTTTTTTTTNYTSYSTLPRYVEACDIPPMYSTVNIPRNSAYIPDSSNSTNSSNETSPSNSIPRAVIRGSNESLIN